jgi:glutamine amidotransferase
MDNLRDYGLVDTVKRAVASGKPFLGICLGMQLLFDESEEFGRVAGLGILPGRVVRFADRPGLKVPHMGWNQIRKQQDVPHLRGIDDGASVYFVHSYYVVPEDASLAATTTDYGVDFVSAVARDNIFATQYHPEKSQAVGLRILQNFGEVVCSAAGTPQGLTASRPQGPGRAGRGGAPC